MSKNTPDLSLDEAAISFLASLNSKEKGIGQQEIVRFVRWYGKERLINKLSAQEIASYAENMSTANADYDKRLGIVQSFLHYAKKESWTHQNLSTHLKTKKKKAKKKTTAQKKDKNSITLTPEGHTALQEELSLLKEKRLASTREIKRAAADKDFRENAPLHAAREQRGHLEGRIKEIEETLKSSVIINDKGKDASRINIGDNVTLQDLGSGKELHYTMVDSREADPLKGKISNVSPIGKALYGRKRGESVEITVPAGKLHYRIEQIGN
ncbi:GreA/GreB family elongation factor [Chloroflexota bacterium]